MRLEVRIELIEHDTRLHDDGHRVAVEGQDAAERLAVVDHQRIADRLPALRRSRAAGQDRRAEIAGDGKRGAHVVLVARDDDADRIDLVDRRVGRVASARRSIEQDVAAACLA